MRPKLYEVARGIAVRAHVAFDVILTLLSLALAVVASAPTSEWATPRGFLANKISLSSSILFVLALLLCHWIFASCNLYRSKRIASRVSEIREVLRAMCLSALALWLAARLLSVPSVTPYFLLIFWAVGSFSIVAFRLLLRFALRAIRRRGHNLHHVLVLGTNPRAIDFGRRIETMPECGYRLIGFVDDLWAGFPKFAETGFPLVADCDSLPEFLRRNVVDEVAIFLPLRSFYERASDIAKLAKSHGILVRLDTNIFDVAFAHQHAETVEFGPQIVASNSGVDGWQLVLKRLLDFVGSLVLLILLSPLFAVVAALIKITSPGKIFFAQERVGLNKRQFTMYKFRTMVPTAEKLQEELSHLNEMSGPVFKIKDDPRVTPIGRILRKTSIDELPQLFNVLRGDMSLVGPRAMSVRDYQLFSEDWQRRRFSVPPGITCLWQVYGRNRIPFEQWMVLDMQYIDGWSLWLDLKILALTIPAVLRGSGAG
jgi:exopolysaccharide biosynthesis polyprenyl glycosylphosphotransferase